MPKTSAPSREPKSVRATRNRQSNCGRICASKCGHSWMERAASSTHSTSVLSERPQVCGQKPTNTAITSIVLGLKLFLSLTKTKRIWRTYLKTCLTRSLSLFQSTSLLSPLQCQLRQLQAFSPVFAMKLSNSLSSRSRTSLSTSFSVNSNSEPVVSSNLRQAAVAWQLKLTATRWHQRCPPIWLTKY